MLAKTTAATAADLRAGTSGVLVPFALTQALAGQFDEAGTAFRAGIEEAERIGAVNAVAALRVSYGSMLLRTDVRASLEQADALLSIADLIPLPEPYGRTFRSFALLQLGDEPGSLAEAERARAAARPLGLWQCLHWLHHVDGLRLLRAGRFADASAVYEELEGRELELGVGEPCTVPYARHAVIAHARAGRIHAAQRVTDRLEERAGRLPCRWIEAAAAACRAELARRERPDEADKQFRLALDILVGAQLPMEQAELHIEHGILLRHDRPREARESFRLAGELAATAGATWLCQRAGEELAAAGGRRVTRRSSSALTPQEQRVARLAATGASNKDIAAQLALSVSTVRSHLDHLYAKLGIHSRRELMTVTDVQQPL